MHPRTAPSLERFLFTLLLALAASLLLIDPAFAQATGSAGNFSCQAGRAVGTLYEAGNSCPTTLSFDNLFSFVVCNMEQLSSNLLGNVYCGMMEEMLPGIRAVLVLAVMFFGISFTIGLIPMAAREFQMFLIKIVIIYLFATQADLLIGIGYKLLVVSMREGVALALSVLNPDTAAARLTSGADVYKQLDGFIGTAIGYATDAVGAKAGGDTCKNAIFGVLAIMAIAFPPMAYIGLAIIFRIGLTFVRAVFGYVYALTGIAFLMTLAPFFLSFYLFKSTKQFFDKWIGYMVAYALQIVILFAFLAFILSINVTSITSSLVDIVIPKKVEETTETTSFRFPWEYCTICEFKVVNRDTGADLAQGSKDFISKGRLVCTDPNNKKPYTVLATVAPDANGVSIEKLKTLFSFTTSGLLSLLVLAYLVEALVNLAPSLAQYIAGSATGNTFATQLGGGGGPGGRAANAPTLDAPGFSENPSDPGILTRYGKNFEAGFRSSGNALGGAAEGIKNAMAGLVGRTDQPGDIQKNFIGFLVDPNKLDVN